MSILIDDILKRSSRPLIMGRATKSEPVADTPPRTEQTTPAPAPNVSEQVHDTTVQPPQQQVGQGTQRQSWTSGFRTVSAPAPTAPPIPGPSIEDEGAYKYLADYIEQNKPVDPEEEAKQAKRLKSRNTLSSLYDGIYALSNALSTYNGGNSADLNSVPTATERTRNAYLDQLAKTQQDRDSWLHAYNLLRGMKKEDEADRWRAYTAQWQAAKDERDYRDRKKAQDEAKAERQADREQRAKDKEEDRNLRKQQMAMQEKHNKAQVALGYARLKPRARGAKGGGGGVLKDNKLWIKPLGKLLDFGDNLSENNLIYIHNATGQSRTKKVHSGEVMSSGGTTMGGTTNYKEVAKTPEDLWADIAAVLEKDPDSNIVNEIVNRCIQVSESGDKIREYEDNSDLNDLI